MNLLELMVKIGIDDQATDKLGAIGGKVTKGLGTVAKVGAAAMTAAGGATLAFGKTAVDAGMSFDSAMSQVAATMGTTTDEIGNLRDFAQEMGSSTMFSATQAAEALNYMALAGYDAETSMNMLPNVLNLAAAGGMELATASDMVTDAQSALGLSLDQTKDMVDQMAAASSKTNTSVEQLGSAILTVGGTAKSLAGGTTELSAALGILADNGIKGAEGGTALRNVLLAMQGDKFDKTFGAMGVSAYDANGNLRPLEETLSDMNKVMEGMTDQEKTDLITNTFNARDLKSVNALLATTSGRWDEVTKAIQNSQGAAEAMAETQMDNLAGDVTYFQSALEGLQIAISDSVTPSLREFVQFATDGISGLTTAFQEGGFEGFVEKFTEIIEDGLTRLNEALPLFTEAVGSIVGAMVEGLAAAAPSLLDAFGQILNDLCQSIIDDSDSITEGAIEFFTGVLTALAEIAPKVVEAMVSLLISLVSNIIGHLPEIIAASWDLMLGFIEGIVNGITPSMDAMNEVVQNALDAALSFVGDMLGAGEELVGNVIDGVASGISDIAETVSDGVEDAVETIEGFFNDMYYAGENILGGFIDGIWSGFSDAVDAVASGLDWVRSYLPFSPAKRGPFSGKGWTLYSGMSLMQAFGEGVAKSAGDAVRSVEGVMDDMRDVTEGGVEIPFGLESSGGAYGTGVRSAGQHSASVVINVNNPVIKEEADVDKIFDYVQTRVRRQVETWNPSPSMA